MQFQSQSNSFSGSFQPPAQTLTPEGLQTLEGVSQRHGVSLDAVVTLLDAVSRGGGTQAQFNHQELGGQGQWQQGGMIMVGDMFNQGLKYRVDSLLTELANLWRTQPLSLYKTPEKTGSGQASANGWPTEFGNPSSSGAQNDWRYAYFPSARRLVIQKNGNTRIYDTGAHQISGVSQQQGGDQTLTFGSQLGQIRISDLPEISPEKTPEPESVPAPGAPQPKPHQHRQPVDSPEPVVPQPQQNVQPPASAPAVPSHSVPPTSSSADDIIKMIERLAELNKKGILTDDEFGTKKAELLGRL